MFNAAALLSFSFLAGAYGQQVGTDTPEVHPTLTWQSCSAGGSCTNNQGSVVLDANWRFLHSTTDSTNCYSGNTWNTTLCPDPTTCATNCALDGANYGGTYGISSSGNALTLQFVTGTNVGSRVYLMASDDTNYHLFKLKNNEFAFDVQVSNLPCGVNGALYFTQMDADGGLSKFPTNKAGAKYGTGYCDAQCPQDIKFINGEANVIGWNGSNGAGGQFGACCNEMDIWEANSVSTAYTTHPCSVDGQYRCSGTACGYVKDGGICDKDGCDFNPYRLGDTSFYGKAFTVDTTNKMTVVTQFKTVDDTDTGALSEIRRFYVQDGKVIQNTKVNIPGLAADDSITAAFCKAQKVAFGNPDDFTTLGGLSSIDKALTKGVVLAMSIWDDYATDLLWLDSNFPASGDPNAPGIARGSCSITSGVPSQVEASFPDSSVTYSNIKFGPIGSTSTGPTTSRRSETASHGSRVRRQWLDRANSVH